MSVKSKKGKGSQRRSTRSARREDHERRSNADVATGSEAHPLLARVAGLRWWLWIPLASGLALRVLHLWFVAKEPALSEFVVLDSALYAEMARYILAGDLWLGREPFPVGPFYAYFLAAWWWVAGDSYFSVFVVQSVIGLGTVALVTLFARRLGSAVGAGIAGVLFAFYAPAMLAESKLLGEACAVFLALGSIMTLVRAASPMQRAAVGGSVLGLACLARPDFLLFVPVCAYWLYSARSPIRTHSIRVRVGGVFLGCSLAVVSLATIRNYWVSGEWVLVSSQGGVTFYQGNNPRAEGTFSIPEGFSGSKQTQEREARAIAERSEGTSLTGREVDAFWFDRGVTFLTQDLGSTALLAWRKVRYWANSAELSTEAPVLSEKCLAPSLRFAFVPFAVFVTAAVLGARRAFKMDARTTSLLFGFASVGFLTAMIFYVSSRYRLGAAAALAVFVAPAVDEIRFRRGWASVRISDFLAAALLCFSLVRWTDAERLLAGSEFYNLGGELYQRREPERAIAYYLTALQARPSDWELRFNLGHALAVDGAFRAASEQFAQVLKLNPGAPDAAKYLSEYRRLAEAKPRSNRTYSAICEF